MASESVVLGGDVNTSQHTDQAAALTGNAFCFKGLQFALAATIILPIVGQLLSVSQLIAGRKNLKTANSLGIMSYFLAILISVAYVAAVLYIFSNRPSEVPVY